MPKVITISEAASIAIHGMVLIVKANKMTNVIQIAEATQSSKHHVAKVFQRLVKANLVDSFRGPNGGFKLRVQPERISFLDIYEAIEGEIIIGDCPLEKPICLFDYCLMGNVIKDITQNFHDYLKSQTLDKYQ